MKKITLITALVLSFFSAHAAFAQNDSVEVSRPSFTLFHEFGNIHEGTEYIFKVRDYWIQRSAVFINYTAKKNERLSLDLLFGGIYWNPSYNSNGSSENVLRYFAATAPRLDLGYAFGDPQTPFLKVDIGILQYKYNDYARNLGEYMFRADAYPTLVYTGGLTYVDVNKASITGLKITHRLNQVFSQDLLLNMETLELPHYDITLAYMAKVNLKNILKINAGIEFARLLPQHPSVTNPDVFRNHYFTFNGVDYVDNPDYYAYRLLDTMATTADSLLWVRGKELVDSLSLYQPVDPLTGAPVITFAHALDSLDRMLGASSPSTFGYFKASSIIPVISFSFDPKPLLRLDIFGPKDAVIYGEAALLGIKDYPVLYANKKDRTIMMVGFNVPTFKFLDVLAVEIEHFASPYPNSSNFYQEQAGKPPGKSAVTPIPQPFLYPKAYSHEDWKKDDMKWSVLAQRSIVKGLSLSAQLASDHSRGWTFPGGRRYWELYRKPSDWYWMFKLTANI